MSLLSVYESTGLVRSVRCGRPCPQRVWHPQTSLGVAPGAKSQVGRNPCSFDRAAATKGLVTAH
jgi:hypothetical protein